MLRTDTCLKSHPCSVWGCKYERALPPPRMKGQKTAEVFESRLEQGVNQVTSTGPIQPKLFHSLEKKSGVVLEGMALFYARIICQVKHLLHLFTMLLSNSPNKAHLGEKEPNELTVPVLFNIICHITGENMLYSEYQKVPKQMMQLKSLINTDFCINAVSRAALSPAGGFLCML